MMSLILLFIIFIILGAIVLADDRTKKKVPLPSAICDACKNHFNPTEGNTVVKFDLTVPEGNDFVLLPLNLLICGVCVNAQAVNP